MSEQRIDIILRARKEGVDEAFKDVHTQLSQQRTVLRDLQFAYREQHEGLYLTARLMSGVGAQVRHVQSIYQTYALGMLNAKTEQERLNVVMGTFLNLGMQMPGILLSVLELVKTYNLLAKSGQIAAFWTAMAHYGPIVGAAAFAAVAGGAAGYFAAQAQRPSAQTIASEAVLVRRTGTATVHEGERIGREEGAGGVSVRIDQLVMNPEGLSPGMAARELGWRLRHLRPEEY